MQKNICSLILGVREREKIMAWESVVLLFLIALCLLFGKREEEKKGGLRVKKKACVCVSEKKRGKKAEKK